jgi:hypothetical protein
MRKIRSTDNKLNHREKKRYKKKKDTIHKKRGKKKLKQRGVK